MNTQSPTPTAVRVSFAFLAKGATPEAVTAFSAECKEALMRLFGLPADAVKVTPRKQMVEGDFTLTCYGTQSRSSPEAMVHAAKRVLPGLRKLRAAAL